MPTRKVAGEVIAAAIEGLQAQKAQIDAQIAEVRRILSGRPAAAAVKLEPGKGKRRTKGAATRVRIAEAQRKRWAAARKLRTAPKAAKPKRRLPAAGRRAIVAAAKKRWAAKRAKAVK
ncbi:MAG: hypothetical protein ACLQKA_05590 [Bryobacteraceae bacterium]